MIYVDLQGYGAGNQLFQYAAARAVQEIMPGQGICVNLADIRKYQCELVLDHFCTNVSIEEHMQSSVRLYGTIGQKALARFFRLRRKLARSRTELYELDRRYASVLQNAGIYQLAHSYAPLRRAKTQNVFLSGNFECWQICQKIRPILLREIRPANPPSKKNSLMMERMKQQNSVLLHVRRGDFLKTHRDICTDVYYQKAVEYIRTHISNPVFYVFSNDVKWVKNKMYLGDNVVYEDSFDRCDVAELLTIMSSCRHFVIANSTLSWWAQFLGDYEQKVVVAPQYGNKSWSKLGYPSTSIMPEWVTIDVTTGEVAN